ncbi:hypothetical protein [Pectobacterium versatile]|uniref:hypothetical protein n=1 Tax=Pectobacterium versatile TaxID=2488639 RepID=UPI000CFF5FED|nr:hypothetical protein [Pectobacterium versatile]PRI21503.1 hypothetical protein BZY99_05005 [Pectobacterium versatile]
MKERGIIFNSDMVRATLSGQKTQTRRIVKPQPDEDGLARLRGGPWLDTSERVYRCPFGKVGDRLWVRETFNGFWLDDDVIQEIKDGISKASELCDYRSDYPDSSQPVGGWTPSIHMPRWASRITLEITGVRVERLNDISEEDCWSEGIDEVDGRFENIEIIDMARKIGCCIDDAKPMFALLWQSIYGEESWQANPWCWTITFKRIEGA